MTAILMMLSVSIPVKLVLLRNKVVYNGLTQMSDHFHKLCSLYSYSTRDVPAVVGPDQYSNESTTTINSPTSTEKHCNTCACSLANQLRSTANRYTNKAEIEDCGTIIIKMSAK